MQTARNSLWGARIPASSWGGGTPRSLLRPLIASLLLALLIGFLVMWPSEGEAPNPTRPIPTWAHVSTVHG